MARPIKKIDEALLEKLAMINCSVEECASTLGVDSTTLQRRYAAVFKMGRDKGKMSLKRQMWRKAIDQDNTVMQIFLSKNMLGYRDRVETDENGTVSFNQSQVDQLVKWLGDLERLK